MPKTPGHNGGWAKGLCGCCSDPLTACYGYFCLPCLYGQNVSDMGEGDCFVNCCIYYILASFCCCCIVHANSRKKLRQKYNLAEEPCGDCAVATFCCACGVCQEANELKHQATVRHGGHSGGVQMAPPPQQHMGQQQYPQYPPQQQQYGAPPPSGYRY